jgi:hypothetical protein
MQKPLTHSLGRFGHAVENTIVSLVKKGRRATPLQFKSMNLVIWPIGDQDYEIARPDCGLEDMSIHICPGRQDLERLSTEGGYRLSDDDWIQGNFGTKLEQCQTAICGFSGRHLAHVIWASVGAEAAKGLLWDPPLELNWSRSTILSGAYTPMCFRGRGAFPFTVSEGLRHLKALGFTRAYTAFHWKNEASRKGLKKAGALFAATCVRMRLRLPGQGVRYVPVLAHGFSPVSHRRWYRRQYTDWLQTSPVALV